MTEQPVVTVIVPVRNEARYIAEQLAALSRQTFDEPWELIVVDHNSTDGTPDIVREWQARLPNLRLEHAPLARNAAGVRNRGAEVATADLLAFCDGDDVVADDWLAAIVGAMPGNDLVVGPRDITKLNRPGSYRYNPSGGGKEQLNHGRYTFVPSLNFAVRREAYLAIGGTDETVGHAEDIDFGFRFGDAGYTIGFASDAMVHRRLRESSRALFRQHYNYGEGGVLLYRRYRNTGMSPPPLREVARELGFLVLRVYWLLEWSRRRHWIVVAGRHAGRISGSVRYRTFYP